MSNSLNGKRVAILVTNGFEQVELTGPKEALEQAGLTAEHAEVSLVPSTKADIDASTVVKFFKLIDMLEDFDDVQNVYHNADIADDVMALVP